MRIGLSILLFLQTALGPVGLSVDPNPYAAPQIEAKLSDVACDALVLKESVVDFAPGARQALLVPKNGGPSGPMILVVEARGPQAVPDRAWDQGVPLHRVSWEEELRFNLSLVAGMGILILVPFLDGIWLPHLPVAPQVRHLISLADTAWVITASLAMGAISYWQTRKKRRAGSVEARRLEIFQERIQRATRSTSGETFVVFLRGNLDLLLAGRGMQRWFDITIYDVPSASGREARP